jgi:phosphocarrier protein
MEKNETNNHKEDTLMYNKEATVVNSVGLHARPATFLIQKANEFKSSIWIENEERKVNAKSLLGVLSLGIGQGESVNIIGDGPDEVNAVNTLCELISSEFAE